MIRDTCGTSRERLDRRATFEVCQNELQLLRRMAEHQRFDHGSHQRRLTGTGRPGHDPVRAVAAFVERFHIQEQQLAVVGAITERRPQSRPSHGVGPASPQRVEVDVARIVNPVVGQDVSGTNVGNPLADLFIGLSQPPLRQLLRELFCLGDADLVGESEEPSLVVDHHPGVAVAGQRLDHAGLVELQLPLRDVSPHRRAGQVEERHPVDTLGADHVLPLRIVDVGDDHGVRGRGLRRRTRVSRRERTTARE